MNCTEKINILCSTDNNYAALCGIMLTSLLENNKNVEIRIFILTQGINNEDYTKYILLGKRYNVKINILEIDPTKFKHCPIWPGDHLSVAAYYRLMASTLLPDTIDKVLYLDSDIIINDSIESLYNQNIDDIAIAAVTDAQFYNDEFYKRLDLPKNKIYFNSGVMLINLRYWREHHVQERCFACIEKHREQLHFHDQDTLNIVLQDEVKILPITYNFQTVFILSEFYKFYLHERKVSIDDIITTSKRPIIIHYTGSHKPWYGHTYHPYKSHFIYYYRKSMWKHSKLKKQKISWIEDLIWHILNILWDLHLKPYPQAYIIKKQHKR